MNTTKTNGFPTSWTGDLTTADIDNLTPSSIPIDGDPLIAELRIEIDPVSTVFVSLELYGGEYFCGSVSAGFVSNEDGFREETTILEDPGTSDRSSDAREAIVTACHAPDSGICEDHPHQHALRALATALNDLKAALQS